MMAAAGGAGAGVEPKSVPDDVYWSDQFGVPGTDDEVYASVKDAWGNIYIGGSFDVAGDVVANRVAKWNASNSTWSALGTGMSGDYPSVFALAVDGSGNLYAGGEFTTAGGVAANYIAKWDGTAWSALGTGFTDMYSRVRALAVDGSGSVYAGGSFTTAGGIEANYIARWDGMAWSALGTGMGGDPYGSPGYAIAVDRWDNVYAGGEFTMAGDVVGNGIAKWDGTTWSALGTGMNSSVNAVALDGWGNVYAGGYFTTAGGKVSGYFATWQPFGHGEGEGEPEDDKTPAGCFGG